MATSAHEAAGAVPVHQDSVLSEDPAGTDSAASRFIWSPGDLILVKPAETSVGKRLADAFKRGATRKP